MAKGPILYSEKAPFSQKQECGQNIQQNLSKKWSR